MNRNEMSQKYWKYYLMLEKHFIESIEFVELHEDNYNTFSNNYTLLIQAIGSELDNVFKLFCGFDMSERKKITHYAQYILKNEPDIINKQILLQEYDIIIQPFQNWNVDKASQTLPWWESYTKIKHNRCEQFKNAKQEYVLNILGALFLLEMLYLKKITQNTDELDIFDEGSNIFTLKNWTTKAISFGNLVKAINDIEENGKITEGFDAS